MATKAYVRRSTGKQSQSIRGQILYLLDWVKSLRREDPSIEPLAKENIFIETRSGKDDENEPTGRPVFVRFLESLKPGDIALFVHNDRLSRNTVVVLKTVSQLKERGIKVLFGNLPIDVTTPEGELMLTNFAAFSKYFLADLRRKTKAGLVAAKAEGKRSGKCPPWFEEVEENGKRVLRPMKVAFEIERSYQLRGPIRTAEKYLPGVNKNSARQKLWRFMKTMHEWHMTADPNFTNNPKPWTRLRDEEREKRRKQNDDEEVEDIERILVEATV